MRFVRARVVPAAGRGSMTPAELLGGSPASLARGLVAGMGTEYRPASGDAIRAVMAHLDATRSELCALAGERDQATARGEP